jgi:uncharacterized protein YecT (DUF1311 family)
MIDNHFPRRSRGRDSSRWLELVALLLVFSCTPKEEATKTTARMIPNGWRPSLEQVQENLEQAVDKNPNKSQQALNRAAQDMADLLDARVFIAYVTLMDALDDAAKRDLFNEQQQWLSQRAEMAQRAVTSKGGSLERLEYAGEYRRITEERLAELQNRVKQVKGSNK